MVLKVPLLDSTMVSAFVALLKPELIKLLMETDTH